MNRKIIFLALGLLVGLTQIKPADNKGKRPAEEQAGPASQQENKSRKIDLQEQFFKACETGDTKRVEQLLKQGLSLREATSYTNGATVTALGVTCIQGHNAVMQTLLDAGVDPAAPQYTLTNGATFSALGTACAYGQNIVVQTLLAAGVDPAAPQRTHTHGKTSTALGLACLNGHNIVVQTLLADSRVDPTAPQHTLTHGATLTALGLACLNGQNTVVQTLLNDQRVDPTVPQHTYTDGKTITALGLACLNGQNTIVQTLLAAGVSFKRITSDGQNAYQVAQNNEIRELIQQHSIKEQSRSPISLDSFKKNQKLHCLECCCTFIFAEEFSEWKYEKLSNNAPLLCPVCQKQNIATELNLLEYPFETQEEEEHLTIPADASGAAPVAGPAEIPDID